MNCLVFINHLNCTVPEMILYVCLTELVSVHVQEQEDPNKLATSWPDYYIDRINSMAAVSSNFFYPPVYTQTLNIPRFIQAFASWEVTVVLAIFLRRLSGQTFYHVPADCWFYSHDHIPPLWPLHSHTLWWQTGHLDTQQLNEWE